MKPYLSIIIPAYNEAKVLPITLLDINKALSKADFTYEIVVVDNNSTDHTREIIQRLQAGIKELRVEECVEQGKANAVKTGMLNAKGEIRLFMDADNSTDIDQFFQMIPYFKQGYNVVIGSRDIKGAKLIPPQPWYRRIAGDMGNIVIQILLLWGMWDTQCGFKAFTERAVNQVFPLAKNKHWAFDVEILSLAKKFGYKIKEVPVIWKNSPSHNIHVSTYFEFLIDVFKIKWRIMTFKKSYNLKEIAKPV